MTSKKEDNGIVSEPIEASKYMLDKKAGGAIRPEPIEDPGPIEELESSLRAEKQNQPFREIIEYEPRNVQLRGQDVPVLYPVRHKYEWPDGDGIIETFELKPVHHEGQIVGWDTRSTSKQIVRGRKSG